MMRATEGILVKIWADTCYFVSEIQSSNSLNYVRRILASSSGLIFLPLIIYRKVSPRAVKILFGEH